MKIKMFSNSEVLVLNALDTLAKKNVDTIMNPHTFGLINAIVRDVCSQLENTDQLKKHGIKIND